MWLRNCASYGVQVDVHDPWVDAAEAKQEYGLDLITTPEPSAYDGILLAVAHDSYRDAGAMHYAATGPQIMCFVI